MDETAWEKCRMPLWPRRTVDGGWTVGLGQTWRRRRDDGRWEYKQEPQSDQEWMDWQV